MKKLIIQSKPNFFSLAEKMGYDIENPDEINEEHVLHKQYQKTQNFVYTPGEKFEINDDENEYYLIINENKYLLICNLEFYTFKEEIESSNEMFDLIPGKYYFHEDGISIEIIKYF